jgi:hypothetical protein
LSESAEEVAIDVTFEMGQIERLFTTYADLLGRVRERAPDEIELAAVSTVLHSFYMGVENMFVRIAKGLDRSVPSGPDWHRRLLTQMTRSTADRGQVVSEESADRLDGYLGFRHKQRHIYSFLLDWGRMENLVVDLASVWAQVKGELEEFLESMVHAGEDGES